MPLGSTMTRARCALVWGTASMLAAGAAAATVPVLGAGLVAAGSGGVANAPFDDLLVWAAALATTVTVAWLWLLTTLVLVDVARGATRRRRGVPEGLRRAVVALCGVALTSGLAAPALAAGDQHTGGPLAGLRMPDRVAIRVDHRPDQRPDRAAIAEARRPAALVGRPASAPVVEVRAGDTLWGLAAGHLGPDATPAEVAAYWPRVYTANRAVIGADPDHVVPGQRLELPATGVRGDAR